MSGSLLTSLLPFFPLFCSLLSSLSPRRLLRALWRICPNYLSYWQLRVNKPRKCVAFSVPLHPHFSLLSLYFDGISTLFKPPIPFFSIHHIFFSFSPPPCPQPQSFLAVSVFFLSLSPYANRTTGRLTKVFVVFSSGENEFVADSVGDVACGESDVTTFHLASEL